MLRGVLAVGAGYVVFTVAAVLLFQLSGVDPHGPSALGFRVFATLYGAAVSFGCGALVAVLARAPRPLPYVAALAAIIATSAAASLVARPGEGAVWSQLSALLLFAPLALAGGIVAWRRRRPAEV